jgi:prepilin-type N-terminal cleavage/methylation domain-containing protein
VKKDAHIGSGFTLVESIVVITVFAMTVAAMGSFSGILQASQRNARYLDIATNAAKDEIENLRNSNYALLNTGQTVDFTSSLPAGLPNGTTGTAAISDPSLPNLKRADVTVTYTIGSTPHTVQLSALIGASGLTQ